MSSDVDVIIVGGGINALSAAALLGKRGRKALVLEREDEIGGCMKSAELAPGFIYDPLATTFVLFLVGPVHAALKDDLERHGLAFSHTAHPTAVLRPDGSAAVLTMDREANRAMFDSLAEGDGEVFATAADRVGADADLIFALLGQGLWTRATALLLAKQAWRRGARAFAAFLGEALEPARGWLESGFASETSRALLAPWPLHVGLGPDSAYSGMMTKVIAFSLEVAGAPIATGGAATVSHAFRGLIEEQGGLIRTGADVARIDVDDGRVRGVTLADGEAIRSRDVIASVTPTQLYGRLLERPSPASRKAAEAFRYGKGNFQLHYALDAPPTWRAENLGNVALIHLTPGVDGVSKAANEAERGLLPDRPTICVGQPTALDPSRAPPGKAVLWVQMPEAPRRILGDARGEIPAPEDGAWTEAVRDAYADRIESILAEHIEGFRGTVLKRLAFSPADLEAANINLVGGDPYGGQCSIDQFFLWRPFKGSVNHRTDVKGLWHIGASTHPGPGLGGGSGFLVSREMG